jgi:hypothetical protein
MFGEDTLLGECWIPLKKYYSLDDGELVASLLGMATHWH